MKWRVIILLAVAVLLPASIEGSGKKAEIYRHPDLPFQFKSFEGWSRVPRPGDDGTFEMISPGGTVRVMLWYTSTEQDARNYLMKMADMKGFDLSGGIEPDSVRTNFHDAVIYEFSGTLLAVIHHGTSARHQKENALYIAQILCPKESYQEHKKLMHQILHSLRITGEGDR